MLHMHEAELMKLAACFYLRKYEVVASSQILLESSSVNDHRMSKQTLAPRMIIGSLSLGCLLVRAAKNVANVSPSPHH